MHMKIAGLTLLRWTREANAELCGMTCKRILQPAQALGLIMHLGGRRERFLFFPGGHDVPPPCWFDELGDVDALLGGHHPTERFNRLPRRRLLDVTGCPGDRRVTFRFAARADKEGDDEISLVLHLIGPAPLSLLIDSTGTIRETSRPAERYPVGAQYAPPTPPALLDPTDMTLPEFLSTWRSTPHKSLGEFLCLRVWGIDQELALALADAIDGKTLKIDSIDREVWDVFALVKARIRAFLDLRHLLIVDPENGRISGIMADVETAGARSANDLLCARLLNRAPTIALDKTRDDWRKFASAQLEKLAAAQAALDTRHGEAQNAEQFKQWADILNIHRARLQKGLDRIELPDPYHDDQLIRIELDSARSVQRNIETYYKKHRRALAARSGLAKEKARLDEAEVLLRQIVATLADEHAGQEEYPVDQWRASLDRLGLSPPRESVGPRRAAPEPRLPYRKFALAGGEIVWVGRSARENDELTLKLAAKSDWFLHAAQSSGAHVILKHGRSNVPPSAQALRHAAAVAAFFSEARHSSVVPVSYTAAKYVRKPRKAAPGLVALIREETMLVAPAPPPGYHDRRNSG